MFMGKFGPTALNFSQDFFSRKQLISKRGIPARWPLIVHWLSVIFTKYPDTRVKGQQLSKSCRWRRWASRKARRARRREAPRRLRFRYWRWGWPVLIVWLVLLMMLMMPMMVMMTKVMCRWWFTWFTICGVVTTLNFQSQGFKSVLRELGFQVGPQIIMFRKIMIMVKNANYKQRG